GTPDAVLRLFHEPRDADYKQLAARYRKLLHALERKSAAAAARVQEELARLSKDHQRVRDIDFFDAPGGAEEIDVTDTLVILGQARQLLLDAGGGRRRLALEGVQQLAVAGGQLLVVGVARLVEQAQHGVRRP